MFVVWCTATRMYIANGKVTFREDEAKTFSSPKSAKKARLAAEKKFGATLPWEVKPL